VLFDIYVCYLRMPFEVSMAKFISHFPHFTWWCTVAVLEVVLEVSIYASVQQEQSHTTIDSRELGIPSALPYTSLRSVD
jgi:hypothetical protein